MNFNTSPIAFYTNRASQPFRASYRQKEIAVQCGETLLPFYIPNVSDDAPDTCELYDPNTDTLIATLTCSPHLLTHTTTVNGVSVKFWIYQGTQSGIFGNSKQGYFYLKIGSYYSDIFRVGALPAEYTEVSWQFFDDIITVDGSLISKYVVYKQIFNVPLWKPTYNVEEEGKTNNGVFFAMQQTTKKACGFSAIVNEAQADVMNLARMADYINVKSCINGQIKTFQTNQFEITAKWESDDVAHIECEFDLFNIVRKYQLSETAPEPLPLPVPPEPPTTYKFRGTTISGVNSVSFVIQFQGETVQLQTAEVIGGSFVFGYNKKIVAFSTGSMFGLTGSTTELATLDFRESCLFSAATRVCLQNCSNLTSVDFGAAKMPNLQTVEVMFANCSKLQTLELSQATFGAQLTLNNYQNNMFSGCAKLTNINLPLVQIAGAAGADFSRMFDGCKALTTINMPLCTFAGANDMSRFMYDCNSLTTINMAAATFADAANMSYAFYGIGIANFTIGSIFPSLAAQPTNVKDLLHNATSTIIDITALDLSNVTDLSHIFDGCKNATTITLDTSDVAQVTNWRSAFNHCEAATNISTLFASFTFANATDVQSLFAYTTENISLPAATFAAATKATNLFSNSKATTLSIPSATFAAYNTDYANICEYAPNLTSINMQSAVFGQIPSGHIYSWFYECNNLTSIDVQSICTQSHVYLLVYSQVIDAASISKLIKFLQNNNSTLSIYQAAYDRLTPAEQTQIQSDLTTYAVNLDFA